MIELLLGIAAIVLAVISIAMVKSSVNELKELEEEVKKLSETTAKSDEKTHKTIYDALENKTPEIEDVGKMYLEKKIGFSPTERAKFEYLKMIVDSALDKDNSAHEYLQRMIKIAERAYKGEIPTEYANTTIRHLLIALDHKIQGMSGLTKGTPYVPKRGD